LNLLGWIRHVSLSGNDHGRGYLQNAKGINRSASGGVQDDDNQADQVFKKFAPGRTPFFKMAQKDMTQMDQNSDYRNFKPDRFGGPHD